MSSLLRVLPSESPWGSACDWRVGNDDITTSDKVSKSAFQRQVRRGDTHATLWYCFINVCFGFSKYFSENNTTFNQIVLQWLWWQEQSAQCSSTHGVGTWLMWLAVHLSLETNSLCSFCLLSSALNESLKLCCFRWDYTVAFEVFPLPKITHLYLTTTHICPIYNQIHEDFDMDYSWNGNTRKNSLIESMN